MNSAVQGGRTCFGPPQLCLERLRGYQQHRRSFRSCCVWERTQPQAWCVQSLSTPRSCWREGSSYCSLPGKREHCQHRQWMSSANTALVKLNQRKRKAARRAGGCSVRPHLPCTTSPGSSEQPRSTNITIPSTKSLQAGDLSLVLEWQEGNTPSSPFYFLPPCFHSPAGAQVLLCVTFLKGCVWPFFQEFSEAPPHGGEPKG